MSNPTHGAAHAPFAFSAIARIATTSALLVSLIGMPIGIFIAPSAALAKTAPPKPVLDAFDYRERAPQQATRDMYLDDKGNLIPGMSTVGHSAVGVLGTVDGM